jgi:hypothetical protein
MRTTLGLVVLACGAVTWGASAGEDGKGTAVKLDDLSSRAPASWKTAKPASSMRFAEFRLPAVKGDKHDAELALFRNAGGDVKANIARWKKAFIPPKGKTIDEVTRITKVKIGGREATYVDIQGTLSPAPFDPRWKGKRWPEFRLLAVQFQGPDNLYHIKLTGPARTVEHYKKGFDSWLAGFKK